VKWTEHKCEKAWEVQADINQMSSRRIIKQIETNITIYKLIAALCVCHVIEAVLLLGIYL
jgi:hypothetical protein